MAVAMCAFIPTQIPIVNINQPFMFYLVQRTRGTAQRIVLFNGHLAQPAPA